MRCFIDHWLRQGIDDRMQAVEALRIQADQVNQRIENAEVQLKEIEDALSAGSADEVNALNERKEALQRVIQEEQEAFEEIMNEMTQNKALVSLRQRQVRIVEEAIVPDTHIRPDMFLWSVLSAIAGLIGAWVAYGLLAKLGSRT